MLQVTNAKKVKLPRVCAHFALAHRLFPVARTFCCMWRRGMGMCVLSKCSSPTRSVRALALCASPLLAVRVKANVDALSGNRSTPLHYAAWRVRHKLTINNAMFNACMLHT